MKISQYPKNGLLYACLSLLITGGLYLSSAHFAFAQVAGVPYPSQSITDCGITGRTCFTGTVVSPYDHMYLDSTSFFSGNATGYTSWGIIGGFLSSSLSDGLHTVYICQSGYSPCQSVGSFYSVAGVIQGTGYLSETSFISTQPNGITSTTTTTGADIFVKGTDISNPSVGGRLFVTFSQTSSFACSNSGAVYDAIYNCSGANSPVLPFSIDYNVTSGAGRLVAGLYNISTTTTFTGGGQWTAKYEIQSISYPWYLLYLDPVYTTIVSTTTTFIIGTSSPMDITRAQIQSVQSILASTTGFSIGALLASSTASVASACNIFTGGNMGDCLTLMIYPPDSTIQDDATILENLPPWGYAFRFYNLLTATTSTSTLPTISYTFASSSPLASTIGQIAFDPLGAIQQSGTLIDSWQSDQGGGNFFQIFEPIIKIIVYLALFMEIARELLGFDWGGAAKKERNLN